MATAIGGRMAGHIERLGWSPGQLAGLQRARLRALLAHAIDRSPFHAAEPRVTISHGGAIARDPRTGKVRRFVPSEPPRPGPAGPAR